MVSLVNSTDICRDIVGKDIVLAVQEFFRSGHVYRGLNSSFIALVPRTSEAISVNQFRSIALGNFLFKIMTKINIADRVANICCRITSPNQFRFIRGRQIGDCIAGASECYNGLRNSARGGHLAIKIDIWKAFDCIS